LSFTLSVLVFMAACCMAAGSTADRSLGVDVAPFGSASVVGAERRTAALALIGRRRLSSPVRIRGGESIVLEWRQPRDIEAVSVHGPALPSPDQVRVAWWRRVWPDNGTGGWQKLDDPHNGNWTEARGEWRRDGTTLVYRVRPLDPAEAPGIQHTGMPFRRTYKLRLTCASEVLVTRVGAHTAAEWREAQVRVVVDRGAASAVRAFDAENAVLLSATPAPPGYGPFHLTVRYAHSDDRLSEDRGLVIVRRPGWHSFSFFVDDVVHRGALRVRGLGATVELVGLARTSAASTETSRQRSVMDRVAGLPEQTLQRAMAAWPRKPARELYLGMPAMRQEFAITEHGDLWLDHRSLRGPGADVDRSPWRPADVRFLHSVGEKPASDAGDGRTVRRWLEKGRLPAVHCEWETDGVVYRQSAIAARLDGTVDCEGARGDEPLVLLERFELINWAASPRTARLWTQVTPARPLRMDEPGLVTLDRPTDGAAREGVRSVRTWIDMAGRGEIRLVPQGAGELGGSSETALLCSVDLAPGERHTFYRNTPYVECLTPAEVDALRSRRYDRDAPTVLAWWEARLSRGMQLECPEPLLNDLVAANLWHVLISTDRDPLTGLFQHGAATVRYPNFANETCMVVQSLLQRGETSEALRLLEPFLASQGARPLPGNFRTKEGLLYAAHPDPQSDVHTAQGYNMHHGWVLWLLAEYWQYTRDNEWLRQQAPKLVAACDWIVRERQATKVREPDGRRPLEWGLAPAGDLEDVEEFLTWYATNAYYHAGLRSAADALTAIGHPDAARLRREARVYRADILASIREAIARSPVVRQRDGSWVPYVPPRAHCRTHRKEGWIREALYPSLHLLDGGVVRPDHPLVGWVLNDLEDNVFLSAESGFGLPDFEAAFFDLGGVTLQPNLLPNAMAHLRRGEPKHFLRVLWNSLAASVYEDARCFAEWVRRPGVGGGPLYKTPDECKWVQFLRNALVLEEGEELIYGAGVPEEWLLPDKRVRLDRTLTRWGETSVRFEPASDGSRVAVELTLPPLAPRSVSLVVRAPGGRPLRSVALEGKPWKRFDARTRTIRIPWRRGVVRLAVTY